MDDSHAAPNSPDRLLSLRKALTGVVFIPGRTLLSSLSPFAQEIQPPSSKEVVGGHKTPRDLSLRLRFRVMKRDNFACRACGASPALKPGLLLHVDHIEPWSRGGETVEENLQTLCEGCNLGKSNVL